MSDIELVIKIPEEMYQKIKETNMILSAKINGRKFDYILYNAVNTGTPLPKGHGKLKDIDKIEWYGCTTVFDCPHKDRECKDCDRAECSKTQVDDIPTIIEADKAESEE